MFGASPTYFVTRPDGTRTALVEVDQLPASIKIAGVPANLPAVDAADMTCVGNMERGSFHYIIEIAAVSPSASFSAETESPLLSGNGEDKEPQNGLGKKKAQVSPNSMVRDSYLRDTFADRTSFDSTMDYIAALSLLVPLLLSQLRSWSQFRSWFQPPSWLQPPSWFQLPLPLPFRPLLLLQLPLQHWRIKCQESRLERSVSVHTGFAPEAATLCSRAAYIVM